MIVTMIFRDSAQRYFYFRILTFILFFLSRFSPYNKGHIHQGDASGHQILHDVRRIDYSSRLLGDDRVDSTEQTHLHNQTRGECIYPLYMYILLCARMVMETQRQRDTINCGSDVRTSRLTYFVTYPFFRQIPPRPSL